MYFLCLATASSLRVIVDGTGFAGVVMGASSALVWRCSSVRRVAMCGKHGTFRGRATWKGQLAGFPFLCHHSERMYTYRIDAVQKGDPLCQTTSPLWRPKDPCSWRSSSAWVICDPVPSLP